MRAKGAKKTPAKKKQKKKEKEKGEKPSISKRPKKKERVAKKQKVVEIEEEVKRKVEPKVEPTVVEEEKGERKAPVPLSAPRAIMPSPQVAARHEGSVMERDARGYSWGELSAAGVEQRVARAWGVPIDIRRRSTVTGNVEKLRTWLQTREPATKSVSVASVPPARAGKKK